MPSSRRSSQTRDQTLTSPALAGRIFTTTPPEKPPFHPLLTFKKLNSREGFEGWVFKEFIDFSSPCSFRHYIIIDNVKLALLLSLEFLQGKLI